MRKIVNSSNAFNHRTAIVPLCLHSGGLFALTDGRRCNGSDFARRRAGSE